MFETLLKPIITPALDIIAGLIPDNNARAEAKEQAEKLLLSSVSEVVKGQIELNKIEAQHRSIFVAGWRPAIGWVCAIGFLYEVFLRGILSWGVLAYAIDAPPLPSVQDVLMEVTFGMLGLGALRTFEKVKKVTK